MKFSGLIRRWMLAGLLVWLPLVTTLLVLRLVVELLDQSLLLLPQPLRPENLLGFQIPGFGILLSLLLVLGTGALVANFLGRRLVELSEAALERIPLIRSVYSGVKRLTHAVMADDSQTFRRVVMVEYPRKGVWSLGFQTADAPPLVTREIGEMMTIYLPTTPNPTSGFILFVAREDVRILDMPVEDALQMIMTLGVVSPRSATLEAEAPKP